MLTLLGRKSSFNVQKVVWLLEELDRPYRHVELGGHFGGLDSQEFRMMNPHGKVPVLKDADHVVWESHAIMRYLAARYGAESFWSEDPRVRSRNDQWLDWSQTVLQRDFLTGVFWGFFRTPADQRDDAAVSRSVEACARHFELIDAVLTDDAYLLGDSLSLADIAIGTHLYRYFSMDIERPKLDNVEAYYERLQSRPGYQKGVMVPFDELFGRLDF